MSLDRWKYAVWTTVIAIAGCYDAVLGPTFVNETKEPLRLEILFTRSENDTLSASLSIGAYSSRKLPGRSQRGLWFGEVALVRIRFDDSREQILRTEHWGHIPDTDNLAVIIGPEGVAILSYDEYLGRESDHQSEPPQDRELEFLFGSDIDEATQMELKDVAVRLMGWVLRGEIENLIRHVENPPVIDGRLHPDSAAFLFGAFRPQWAGEDWRSVRGIMESDDGVLVYIERYSSDPAGYQIYYIDQGCRESLVPLPPLPEYIDTWTDPLWMNCYAGTSVERTSEGLVMPNLFYGETEGPPRPLPPLE